TDVEIQPPVIVEVAKVAPHAVNDPVQAGLLRHIGKRAITVIAVKPCPLGGVRQAEVISGDVAHVTSGVTGNENVRPAVVVVIEEPGGKTAPRWFDAGCGGDIG